ncbi:DMT family transporter [Vibrio sp.]|uniref:DMT family transporter n=1 Tax=Vibrio sp. TaxID=678 RepID=UPI003D113704
MSAASFLRLLTLAAIWGGSFLFMRLAAHSFGPAYLIEARVGLAALSLLIMASMLGRSLPFRQHWRHFMLLALFNSALPFLLFGYAALSLSVSTLSILNSTAPIWGAVIGFFWLKTPLTRKALLGLLIGITGVAVIVGLDPSLLTRESILPIAAATGAACCYGIATNYTKLAPSMSSFDSAHGSMWAATIWILPLLALVPMRAMPTGIEIASVVALGVICTGLAYLMYFRLVQDIGASSTLTVTFLIPAFGIFWGNLILDEPVTSSMLSGAVLVLTGTMLVTGFSPKQILAQRRARAQ